MFAIDLREERFDLTFERVIDSNGDSGAASRDNHLGGLIDRLRTFVRRRVVPHAAPRAVDDGAGFTERAGNAAPRAARRAGNHRHSPGERLLSLLRSLCHDSPQLRARRDRLCADRLDARAERRTRGR